MATASGHSRLACPIGMALRQPKARASEEAELTTPRLPTPPTSSGRPRRLGSFSTSTLAKKASRSAWSTPRPASSSAPSGRPPTTTPPVVGAATRAAGPASAPPPCRQLCRRNVRSMTSSRRDRVGIPPRSSCLDRPRPASGFPLPGPAIARGSAGSHHPSGGGSEFHPSLTDVHGGVVVSIDRSITTSTTPEDRLALTAFFRHVLAQRAGATGKRRRHLYESASIPQRLVGQLQAELPPPAGKDLTVQTTLLLPSPTGLLDRAPGRCRHGLDIQPFDRNETVLAGESAGRLVQGIPAAVPLPAPHDSNLPYGPAPPSGAFALAGSPALQAAKPLSLLSPQPRHLEIVILTV